MSEPIVAAQDQTAIEQYMQQLPHALLIIAEEGMDTQAVTDALVSFEPSDVQHIMPVKDKRSISVERIRTFIDATRTYASRRRIAVVRPAETMTAEAQNALLKTLEEPSTGLHIILEARTSDSLLATVVSRCQTLVLHRTTSSQDMAVLEQLRVPPAVRQQILFLAAGRPALIRELAHGSELLASYQSMASDAKKIISEVTPHSLAAALSYSADRQSALRLIDIILTMTRFQLQRKGLDDQLARVFDAATDAEIALQQNGNTKLALISLAVR